MKDLVELLADSIKKYGMVKWGPLPKLKPKTDRTIKFKRYSKLFSKTARGQ